MPPRLYIPFRITGRIYSKLLTLADKKGCHVFSENVKLFRYRSERYRCKTSFFVIRSNSVSSSRV